MGGKVLRDFRNNYKGLMDKTKGGNLGRKVRMAGEGEVVGVNADNCT